MNGKRVEYHAHLLMVAVSATLCIALAWPGPVNGQPAPPQIPARPVSRVSIDLRVHEPMSASEWRYYAHVLMLSEAQVHAIGPLFDAAMHDDQQLRQTRLLPLIKQSSQLADQRVGSAAQATTAFIQLIDQAHDVRTELTSVEQAFFESIRLILAPAQHERLLHVEHARARRRAAAVTTPIAGALHDHEQVISDMLADGADVPLHDAAVWAILNAYDRAITPLVLTRANETLKDWPRQLRLSALAQRMWLAGDAAALEEAQQAQVQAQQIMARQIERALEVIRVNQHFVEAFTSVLPANSSAHIRAAFIRRTCPPLYPDAHDIRQVLHAVKNDEHLTGDQRLHVDRIESAYIEPLNVIAAQLISTYLDWRTSRILSNGTNQHEYAAYARRMRQLMQQRSELARAAMDALASEVQTTVGQDALRHITNWKSEVARIDHVRHGESSSIEDWPSIKR